MNTQEAYELGKNHGHGFACHNIPQLGDKLWLDDLGRVTVDAENIREVHQSLCFAAESNSRQCSFDSPFNESEDSDALWQAYDQGIADAIFADLATYTDEDYGVENVRS